MSILIHAPLKQVHFAYSEDCGMRITNSRDVQEYLQFYAHINRHRCSMDMQHKSMWVKARVMAGFRHVLGLILG